MEALAKNKKGESSTETFLKLIYLLGFRAGPSTARAMIGLN